MTAHCTMYFLTVTLFLSLFLVTQASDLSSELNQSPLSESVYVFLVKSDAPIAEIKGSFNVIGGPRLSFRIIGENNYCFVAASNDTMALRQLTFPEGSSVIQYPVAHVEEYYQMFGLNAGYKENDTNEALPDTVLSFIEWDYNFSKGMPVKLFDLIMSGLGKELLVSHEKMRPIVYYPIAYYPTKMLAFSLLDDNVHQHILKDLQDIIGGTGILTTKMKHIVKI